MDRRSDIERALQVWMVDGPTAIPDRVVDVVAARIGVQHQRRAWRLQGRPFMNAQLKALTALAAAVVVAVVGWNLLPRSEVPGTPTASPTATTPTTAPSPTARVAAVPPLPEGVVSAAGTYRLHPLDSAPGLIVDATVPAGWIGGPPCCLGGPVGESNGPNGIGLALMAADGIFSDPCQWDLDGSGPGQPGDIEVGPSVDELASALAANPAYEATTPTDVTIGGFAGKRVDVQLPSGECDTLDGKGVYFLFGGREGYVYAQGDGNHWQVSIVDVDGTRLIAALFWYAETSAADVTAGQAIVDSLVITP